MLSLHFSISLWYKNRKTIVRTRSFLHSFCIVLHRFCIVLQRFCIVFGSIFCIVFAAFLHISSVRVNILHGVKKTKFRNTYTMQNFQHERKYGKKLANWRHSLNKGVYRNYVNSPFKIEFQCTLTLKLNSSAYTPFKEEYLSI